MTIPNDKKEQLFNSLKQANSAFNQIYPGDRSDRQPVHTLYGGANLFKSDAALALGARALEILQTYAPNHEVFGSVFGFSDPKFSQRIMIKWWPNSKPKLLKIIALTLKTVTEIAATKKKIKRPKPPLASWPKACAKERFRRL